MENPNSIADGQTKANAASPLLIAMLIIMAVFPFLAKELPTGLLRYLDLLYK